MFVYSRSPPAVNELASKGDWPAVSPDGSRVIYRDLSTGLLGIVGLSPSAKPQLLGLGPLWYPPTWSVDGDYILGNEKGAMKLVILRLSDGKRQEVRIWDEDLKAQLYALVRLPGEGHEKR